VRALVFQLYGPLAAWGEVAVGQVRPSAAYPGPSALLGLIAASLGIPRRAAERWDALAGAYAFAVEVWGARDRRWSGRAEWDFHTVQTVRQATVKRAGGVRSRRDALKLETYTFTSQREHRTDGYWRAAAVPRDGAPYTLEDVADAMRSPAFPLYLGRRACPLGLPLDPRIVEGPTLIEALRGAPPRIHRAEHPGSTVFGRIAHRPETLHWDVDLDVGLAPQETVERRDAVRSRARWQFGARREHRAALPVEE